MMYSVAYIAAAAESSTEVARYWTKPATRDHIPAPSKQSFRQAGFEDEFEYVGREGAEEDDRETTGTSGLTHVRRITPAETRFS